MLTRLTLLFLAAACMHDFDISKCGKMCLAPVLFFFFSFYLFSLVLLLFLTYPLYHVKKRIVPFPSAQVYAVLPAAAAFMIGYNWLSNHVGSRALFHLTITPFFIFYAVFAFVMYPMRGVLHHAAGVLRCCV